MSLPRRRATAARVHLKGRPCPDMDDFSIIMPAVQRLRAAGSGQDDLLEAVEHIPGHLVCKAIAFASERQSLPWGAIQILLDLIGLDVLARGVGDIRACDIWRRFKSKTATDE